MLFAFAPLGGRLQPVDTDDRAAFAAAVWIDLVEPTEAEKKAVERGTGLHVSSAAELQEIESSSRMSTEHDTLYLSVPMVLVRDRARTRTASVGFALSRDRLLTVRYAPSRSFDMVHERAPRFADGQQTGGHVMVTLLEVMVDRLADELEKLRDELDGISARIFQDDLGSGRAPRREDAALRGILKSVGTGGDLIARIRDSLLGVGRIVPYTVQSASAWLPQDLRPRLDTVRQDVLSLSDYDTYLTGKVQFLLDATLGYINIAQNNIIKVLTVVSVVGIPPTLVASVYGMNFKTMPELNWAWGYPYGLALIVLSAVLPLALFRLRGWL